MALSAVVALVHQLPSTVAHPTVAASIPVAVDCAADAPVDRRWLKWQPSG
jgi:hypothetical protein